MDICQPITTTDGLDEDVLKFKDYKMAINLLLRYRPYLLSIEMILVCFMLIISSIQATVLDVPVTADSVSGSTVYTLFTEKKSWKEARQVCREHGGYLINIETEAKYQKYISMKTSAFSSSIESPWTGLHWTSSTSRHWDGPGCPPPQTHLSASYHWRDHTDFNYDAGELCYREIDNGFQRFNCQGNNTFICEHYSDGTCRYDESTITSFTYQQFTSTSDECKVICSNTTGCFLTADIHVHVCLMLLASDVSNTTVSIKNCSYETAIDSNTYDVERDDTDPTDCANPPSNLVSSTTTCTTVTSTTTETTTFMGTSTETTTSSTTITFTDMSTVTQFFTYWSSTKASVAFTETTTDNMTGEVPTDSLVVTQPEENAMTTVSQINTEAVVDSSLVVTTVTETQIQSYDTSTDDVRGSCPSIVLYSSSPCPSETVQTIVTTIQPSCVSLQVNDTMASSSTGVTGVIGSDGIMRATLCRDVIVVTPDPTAEQEAVESIVKELTVDKRNISAIAKKKQSAQDKRPSSVAIGYIGIVFLIIPFLLIIAVDLPTCIQGGRNVIKVCKDEERF